LVDETLILRKLSDLETYLKQISSFKNTNVAEYRNDWKLQRIVERTLQMMIETCVDISGHIISERDFRVPTTYTDTFHVLYEEGILNAGLFNSLKNMVKFRNVVVHDYDKIDPEIVVGILQKQLGDFTDFRDSIIRFLKPLRTEK
jgi:uncharacterized protein YutE (UPF0331/DUF86 family)